MKNGPEAVKLWESSKEYQYFLEFTAQLYVKILQRKQGGHDEQSSNLQLPAKTSQNSSERR
jgi:hypothetical protein